MGGKPQKAESLVRSNFQDQIAPHIPSSSYVVLWLKYFCAFFSVFLTESDNTLFRLETTKGKMKGGNSILIVSWSLGDDEGKKVKDYEILGKKIIHFETQSLHGKVQIELRKNPNKRGESLVHRKYTRPQKGRNKKS